MNPPTLQSKTNNQNMYKSNSFQKNTLFSSTVFLEKTQKTKPSPQKTQKPHALRSLLQASTVAPQ